MILILNRFYAYSDYSSNSSVGRRALALRPHVSPPQYVAVNFWLLLR